MSRTIFLSGLALAAGLTLSGCPGRDLPAGQCLFDSDCSDGQVCRSNYCRTSCHSDRDCPTGESCVEGEISGQNVCQVRQAMAECTRTSDCPTGLVCRTSHCVAECQTNYDCQVINPAFTCVSNTCRLVCAAGLADCNADPRDGCEIDTRSDTNHCGSCTNMCSVSGGSAVCSQSTCGLGVCNSGLGNCDGNSNNGCETDTTSSTAHCGACGHACATGELCSLGVCRLNCAKGTTNCGGTCVFTQSNNNNCGACNNRCATGTTCREGACTAICPTGQTMCTDQCVDLQTSVNHCGACGTACSVAGATATCVGGVCGLGACNTGLGNCDGNAANGCETTVTTNIMHCGACGHACVAPGNGTTSCVSGTCTPHCNAGYALVSGACISLASIGAPSLRSPSSSVLMLTAAVRFEVTLARGTDGVTVEVCRDRACTMSVGRFSATGASVSPTATLPPGRYFWRAFGRIGAAEGTTASTQTWSFILPNRTAGVVGVSRIVPDVNGDGIADLVVGMSNRWSVAYFQGGASPTSMTTPTQTVVGPVESSFGQLVGVGDFNGDGYGDLATGTDFENTVTVHSGSASGLSTTATTISPDGGQAFGSVVSPSVDLDGDGFNDLIVSACNAEVCQNSIYLVRGSASGLSTVPTQINGPIEVPRFGLDVTALGQTDNEASPELAVVGGARSSGTQIYLYHGADLSRGDAVSPFRTINITADSERSVDPAIVTGADINGDGYNDLVLLLPRVVTPYEIRVYRGGAAGISAVSDPAIVLPQGPGDFRIATIGDYNRDGFDDIIASSPGLYIQFLFGSARGLALSTYINFKTSTDIGRGLGYVGDFNSDGLDDLFVGAPPAIESCIAEVAFFAGTTAPPSMSAQVTIPAPARCTSFGSVLGNH